MTADNMQSSEPPDADLTVERLVALYQAPSNEPALAGLDAVPWKALNDFDGYNTADWASDVPALLRATLSENDDHRNFAFQLLHELICHQGTVCEASPYAVPFLFQLLESPRTRDKRGVAFLLASLATSNSQREWAELTRAAVGIKLEQLYTYLDDDDTTARWAIAEALACYPDRLAEVHPLLEQALTKETNPLLQESLHRALAKLTGDYSVLPQVRNASLEPVERRLCPRCGAITYLAQGGQDICPACGYGTTSAVNQPLPREDEF